MFFSIVIPTRNRPYFLKNSIRSVLDQDFKDYELIVSDNSSPNLSNEVKEVVISFDDKRIKYIRPESELDMGKHWNWAVQQATGEYIGILTDRMLFKRLALSRLKSAIDNYHPNIISYIWDTLKGDGPPYKYRQQGYSDCVVEYYSDHIIRFCSNCIFPHFLPRALNSVIEANFLHKLYEIYKHPFESISPDYLFCFIVLDSLDTFHHLDNPIVVSWGDSVSNGSNYVRGRFVDDVNDFIYFLKNQGGLKHAPILTIKPIPYNGIFHEYNYVKSIQKSGRFQSIIMEKFYLTALQKIERLERRFLVNMKPSRKLLEEYRNENKLKVHSALKGYHMKRETNKILRFMKHYAYKGAYHLPNKIGMDFGFSNLKSETRKDFQNVEEVLNFDEKYPKKHSEVYSPPERIFKGAYRRA